MRLEAILVYAISVPTTVVFSTSSSFVVRSTSAVASPMIKFAVKSVMCLPAVLSCGASVASFPSFVTGISMISIMPRSASLAVAS